ncbi:MAG: hypothetical protein R3D55_25890 [Chloroflexota bacterium]
MNQKEFRDEYIKLAHAVQTGIAACIAAGWTGATPKHLRVGIDTSKSDHGALIKLLLEKGVITEGEYQAVLLEGLEREVDGFKSLFQQLTGKKAEFY